MGRESIWIISNTHPWKYGMNDVNGLSPSMNQLAEKLAIS